MSKIFFYGLFMDEALLTSKGLGPKVLGPAVLRGYRIQIGARATLLPAEGRLAYGIVMELGVEDARALYADPSVSEYVAEGVQVELIESGQAVEADCYNLSPDLASAGTNPAYAAELARLAKSLQFDPDYVAEITAFTRDS